MTVVGATVKGSSLVVAFSGPVACGAFNSCNSFAVKGPGNATSGSGAVEASDRTKVDVSLGFGVPAGTVITVDYAASGNITDQAGNPIPAFSNEAVTDLSTASTASFTGATVKGGALVIAFSAPIICGSGCSGFLPYDVTLNNRGFGYSGKVDPNDATKVDLSLSPSIAAGDTMTLSYSFGPVTDQTGNPVPWFTNQPVTNLAGQETITQNIPLSAGWHLVSFSFQPTSTALTTVLSSLGSNYDIVLGFDASQGGAQSYFTSPSMQAFNTLTTLQPLRGYWVHLTTNATWSLTGTTLPSGTTLTLTPGWDLVGYSGAAPEALSTAFGHLNNSVDIALSFDPSQGGALSFFTDPNMALFNNLNTLQPNAGYWLHLTGSGQQWAGQ